MSERIKTYVCEKTITNGEITRNVVVVGIMKEKNTNKYHIKRNTCLKNSKNGTIADVIYKNRVREKVFKIGYAICNTEDSYDKNVGIKIAKSRARKSPVGVISTTSFSMLQDDQCNALIENEAKFIEANIEKYIL